MSYSWIAGNEHIPDSSDLRVGEFEFGKKDRLWPNDERLGNAIHTTFFQEGSDVEFKDGRFTFS